jgi:hypothetical protein
VEGTIEDTQLVEVLTTEDIVRLAEVDIAPVVVADTTPAVVYTDLAAMVDTIRATRAGDILVEVEGVVEA